VKNTPQKEEGDEKKDLLESLKDSILQSFALSIVALIIFVVGKFFWWLGFILFLVFSIYLLIGFLVAGLVFLFLAWIFRLISSHISIRGLKLEKIDDEFQRIISYGGGHLAVVVAAQLYCLLVLCLLGYFFYCES